MIYVIIVRILLSILVGCCAGGIAMMTALILLMSIGIIAADSDISFLEDYMHIVVLAGLIVWGLVGVIYFMIGSPRTKEEL